MAPGRDREPLLAGGLPTQYVDVDPEETSEWLDSLDQLVDAAGPYRARYLMLSLLRRAAERNVGRPQPAQHRLHQHDPAGARAVVPRRRGRRSGPIRRLVRWNAAIMVHRAQRPGRRRRRPHLDVRLVGVAVRGRASTTSSGGRTHPGGGDQVFFQGHASPGIYARAFLEGRLDRAADGRLPPGAVARRRRAAVLPAPAADAVASGSSRPCRWAWARSTRSTRPGSTSTCTTAASRTPPSSGCGPSSATARWTRSSSRGAIGLAAREELDNLVFVVNCNLQRLDGPVRGNGKIIQELESFFRGAGWNVIKVIWGRKWDDAARQGPRRCAGQPDEQHPRRRLPDLQGRATARSSASTSSAATRARAKLVEDWTDDGDLALQRGGHDYRKLYAAYRAATETTGQPTVIIAKTIKGWTLGSHFEGRNSTHQMKKLTLDDLKDVPRPAAHPHPDSLHGRRTCRRTTTPVTDRRDDPRTCSTGAARSAASRARAAVRNRPLPAAARRQVFDVVRARLGQAAGRHDDGVRPPAQGPDADEEHRAAAFVPIIPDEARTFGMDSMFPTAKIYSPHGQNYTLGRPRTDAVLQGVRRPARSCTRASTRPVRWRRSWRRGRRTPPTASR